MATASRDGENDAMEVDTAVSPEDEGFLESLGEQQPLKQIVSTFLDSNSGDDAFEVQLRQQCLKLAHSNTKDALLQFWKSVLQAVYHIVLYAEKEREADSKKKKEASPVASGAAEVTNDSASSSSRYKYALPAAVLSHLRKLPVILLEDILDVLPTETAYTFWNETVSATEVSTLLFGKLLWHPAPTQHPCWLPFLKISNKFLRRLQGKPREAGNVLQTLSTVYPISEKSATQKIGSHNPDHLVQFESEDIFDEEHATAAATSVDTTTKASSAASTCDYNFYETFWKLQHDLRSPNAIAVADFLNRLKTVLHAFQSHPVSSSSILFSSNSDEAAAASSAMEIDDDKSPSSTPEEAVSPHLLPFLTQSHLLPIQLRDPALRSIVLTQFWIVAQHLLSQVPTLRAQLLTPLKVAESLMLPLQLGFLQTSAVLQISEPQWRQWKKDKCQPDLEKQTLTSSSTNAFSSVDDDDTRAARKRKREADNTEEEKAYEWQGGQADLIKISQKMCKAMPSAKDHLEDYVDALDPDAGIEAEYHPKNDAVFTWRALRVLAVDDLEDFSQIRSDGDFEGMVRDIYQKKHGVDIPGEAPADLEDAEEVHNEPEQNITVKQETEKDEVSNDDRDTEIKDEDTKKSPEQAVDAGAKDNGEAPKDETTAMDVDDADAEPQQKSKTSPTKKDEQEAEAVSDKPAPPNRVVENGGTKADNRDGVERERKRKSTTPPRGSRSRSPIAGPSNDDGRRRNEGRDHSRSRGGANGHRDNRRNYDGRGSYEQRRDDRDRGGSSDHRGDRGSSGSRQRGPQPRGGGSRGDDRQGEEVRRDEWRGDRGGGGDRNQRSRGGDRDDRRGGRRGGGGHRR